MMKRISKSIFTGFFIVFLCFSFQAKGKEIFSLKEGDILFQITDSPQSKAIQLATGSKYTHCGIVLEKDGKLQVFEAIGKVDWIPVDQWIKRGIHSHYVVMRLKETDRLTPDMIRAMRADTAYFRGKEYDLLFQWSDGKIYCSELVWKIYKRNTRISLSPVKTFADYDLDHQAVREMIRKRYGQDFKPDEKVVAPSDLMESDFLKEVFRN